MGGKEEVTAMDLSGHYHQSPTPRPHIKEVEETHALCDTCRGLGWEGQRGRGLTHEGGPRARPSYPPVILGSQRDEVTLVNVSVVT